MADPIWIQTKTIKNTELNADYPFKKIVEKFFEDSKDFVFTKYYHRNSINLN